MSSKRYYLTINTLPQAAQKIAHVLQGGEVLALIGGLGSGKTTFTQALGRSLHVKRRIVSPTFIVMQHFTGRLPKNKKPVQIFHLDLYRTKNFREVKLLGIEEIWKQPNYITVIEWADVIRSHLPAGTIYVYFKHLPKMHRLR